MKIKIIDLTNKDKRENYSKKLQQFENQFNYPLGNKTFTIKHGFQGNFDYFSFFEQMGKVFYFVVEDADTIIGAGCAILKTVNKKKIWYLCDFKITPKYRGKSILEKIMVKFFIPLYFLSQKMTSVNMSPIHKNGLISRVKNIFKFFKIDTNELYFFEWSVDEIFQSNIDLSDFFIVTNKNKKDIVIDNEIYPIYHLVHTSTDKDFSEFQKVSLTKLRNQRGQVMYSSTNNTFVKNLLTVKTPSTIGTLISHRFNDRFPSSAEI